MAVRKSLSDLSVYKDRIEQTVSNEKIEFDDKQTFQNITNAQNTQTVVNSLGLHSCC